MRLRDTRLYVDFLADLVVREYTAREDGFQNVQRVRAPPLHSPVPAAVFPSVVAAT